MKRNSSRKPKYHSETSTEWYLMGIVLLAIVFIPVAACQSFLTDWWRKHKRGDTA